MAGVDPTVQDAREDAALNGILAELTSLRAGCGLPPPPGIHFSSSGGWTGVKGPRRPEAGTVTQHVEPTRAQDAVSTDTNVQPAPPDGTSDTAQHAPAMLPPTTDDLATRAAQEDSVNRLLGELSAAGSAQIRAGLLLAMLAPLSFITCNQMARIVRYLELPSEKIEAAKMMRGKLEDPENIAKSLLPLLSSGSVDTCASVMSILCS
eukprot:m.205541 g.205541  ORF g.205541 m.205541 type:complete len:207 (+) comp22992_c0_seq1:288-908(+)